MCLLTQTYRFVKHPFAGCFAIKYCLNVVWGAQVQNHGHQIGIAKSFSSSWWILNADSHPQTLTMLYTFSRAHVLAYYFQNHLSAQFTYSVPTDPGKFLCDA